MRLAMRGPAGPAASRAQRPGRAKRQAVPLDAAVELPRPWAWRCRGRRCDGRVGPTAMRGNAGSLACTRAAAPRAGDAHGEAAAAPAIVSNVAGLACRFENGGRRETCDASWRVRQNRTRCEHCGRGRGSRAPPPCGPSAPPRQTPASAPQPAGAAGPGHATLTPGTPPAAAVRVSGQPRRISRREALPRRGIDKQLNVGPRVDRCGCGGIGQVDLNLPFPQLHPHPR